MLWDVPVVLRSLRKRLGFSLVVVTTLSLGVGGAATMFSIVDAVLLRPLPYAEPERLVWVYETVDGDPERQRTLSFPDFEAVRDGVGAFEQTSAIESTTVTYTDGQRADRWLASRVSPDFFETLGVKPALGRTLTAAGEGSADETVLGHDLWQRRFGGDPEILGRLLVLDGQPHTVVGVMSDGFHGLWDRDQLWTSLDALTTEERNHRSNRYLGTVARLADDAELPTANSQLAALFAHLENQHPDSNTGYSATAVDLHQRLLGDQRRPALLLLLAVGLLLGIACTNVAHMLLVEHQRRQRQAAIRIAVGARPGDLLRFTLTETLILGLAGGGLGLLFASWGLSLFEVLDPMRLPAHARPVLDVRVLGFTLVLAVAIGLALGLPRALRGASGLSATLLGSRQGNRSHQSSFARRWLLASEVALALLVTLGTALTAYELHRLQQVDPGFASEGRQVFRIALPDDFDSHQNLRASLLERIGALPGIDTATLASDLPLDGQYSATLISPEGAVARPDVTYGGGHRVYRHRVEPNYFGTLEIPLRSGRGFDARDHGEAPGVAVVSEQLASSLWPGLDPLGRRFHLGPPPEADSDEDLWWYTVVGVVADVHHRSLRQSPTSDDPHVYFALSQQPERTLSGVVVTRGPTTQLENLLRDAVAEVHPEVPVFSMTSLDDHVAAYTDRTRFSTLTMMLFSLLALILAAVGIYGVVTQQVDERTQEIGIRMALGARSRQVLATVVRDAMTKVALGLALGLTLAVPLARWLDGRLIDLGAANPVMLVVAVPLLATVGLVASLLPAHRASRVDPLVSLRDES